MENDKLWGIFCPGPNYVYASASRADAEQEAIEFDEEITKRGLAERHGVTPESLKATVIEWPANAELHAACLETDQPFDLDGA